MVSYIFQVRMKSINVLSSVAVPLYMRPFSNIIMFIWFAIIVIIFYTVFFFSGGPVKCICADNISIHYGNRLSIDYTYPPEQILRSLNNTEREILYLYFIKRRKIKEISKITCLSVSKIYYRIRMIKIKFGAETTRKLPILFRCYL